MLFSFSFPHIIYSLFNSARSDGKKEYSLPTIRAIYQRAGFESTSKSNPYLFADFMENGEGVAQSREESNIASQPIDNVENSTQDPADGSNDHANATANGDKEDSEDEGDFDEEGIVAYLNTLNDMIVSSSRGAKINSVTNCGFATDRQTRCAARRLYTRPQVWQNTLRAPKHAVAC